jgi:uncharacterized protein (UPF0261 family)/ABC-type branched-subunit amino acid transport system ATPase component
MADGKTISVAVPALAVSKLAVSYGGVPALHGLDLTLERGVLAVVGRNGMGKTTLCRAIMGLTRTSAGSVRALGTDVTSWQPHNIARHGVGYVPQGRRCWPSLSVDEHLKLGFRGDTNSAWTVERVYDTFHRLAERKSNGGAQLSGGEQQMLAIGRALLGNPRLMVMDEPSEGLAPVIVQQVADMLKALAADGNMSVLLIEQNIGVALEVSDRIAVMLHGQITREMASATLAADKALQQRLVGVGRHADEPEASAVEVAPAEVTYIRVDRQYGEAGSKKSYTLGSGERPAYSANAIPNRWSADNRQEPSRWESRGTADAASTQAAVPSPQRSVASALGRSAYVVGTFDTKTTELTFIARELQKLGLKVITVDLATSGRPSSANIGPQEVARHHPGGAKAVFTGDRGSAVTAMATAFEYFIVKRKDVGGVISAGGSGATALATPGMRALPIGIPKFMVSTVASGDVGRYVGASDISMMYSVTDVAGINRISEQVLANAAHALGGMILHKQRDGVTRAEKRSIGLTMFGVTTPCVQMVARALQDKYDCLTFHATGTGGQSMEKLVDSGLISGVIDATTTEIADHLVGGVFSAGPDRLGAIIRSKVPYVGSCGALDMVNFGARDTVPAKFSGRKFHVHNANVTLMRTTPEENEAMGRWIADRLNRMTGPVRFLIPDGGVSMLDAPGQPFSDPKADKALFDTITRIFAPSSTRKLIRLPNNINDPEFAKALVASFEEIMR